MTSDQRILLRCGRITSTYSRVGPENLYVGVTNDLAVRLWQHRNGEAEFTRRYRIDRLVYFEVTNDAIAAITREKQIKAYRRAKKTDLISGTNPAWNDLAEGLGLDR